MDRFKPNYNFCNKPQKSIHFEICDKMHKNTVMVCGIDRNKCSAWKGYVHNRQLDMDYGKDNSFNFHRDVMKKK